MRPNDTRFLLYMAALSIFLSIMVCGCSIHYDRPKVRQCEAEKARALERLYECENPKPAPAVNWFDWWIDS